MWFGDDFGDLADGEWRQHWRLGGWGVETDVGDLAAWQWRQRWRLGAWGLKMTFETSQMWSGDDVGDLVPGDWS